MNMILTTPHLYFSAWKAEDIYTATLLWGNKDVTRYITATGIMSSQQIHDRLNKEIQSYSDYRVQYWKLCLKQTNEFIGCCGLRPYNAEQGVYEIGIHLLPQHWGKGYAKQACEKVIDYASKELSINKLFGGHNPNNVASAALLKSLGFVYSHDEYYEPTGLYHPSYFKSL